MTNRKSNEPELKSESDTAQVPELCTIGGVPTGVQRFDDAAAKPGMIIGNFCLETAIGRGGMGEVWKARDETGDRSVVIKFVPPELRRFPEELARVKHTFQKVHALQHQHICPLYLLDEDPNLGTYLVMKFIDGMTLSAYRRKYIDEQGDFPVSEVVRVLKPVALALDYAHSKKIVHRDIKPQNIMVSRDGSDVQVVDFGLVAEFLSSMTRVSRQQMDSSGTYPYMAPEQWKGQFQDAATDQYALGVVIYEMLSGRLPFEAADANILRMSVLSDDPEPLETAPDFVNNTIRRAMGKERSARFENCVAFVNALENNLTAAAPSDFSQPSLCETVSAVPLSEAEAEVPTTTSTGAPTAITAKDSQSRPTPKQNTEIQRYCSRCSQPRKEWHHYCTRCGTRFV